MLYTYTVHTVHTVNTVHGVHTVHLYCTVQEDPYIMLDQPTACTATKGSLCQMVADSELGTSLQTAQ